MRFLNTLLLATSAAATAVTSSPRVTIKNGTVVGRHNYHYNQDFFMGIPYAQAPVGDLRYRRARPLVKKFNGDLDASNFRSYCVGFGTWMDPGQTMGEDCLHVNVFRTTKDAKKGRKLPVAVWIHGGGYVTGGSPYHFYNFSYLLDEASKTGRPFVAASFNYRLGPWGFMLSKELQAEGNTNLGTRDTRLALHWIKENIAAFGGDPDNISIFGDSAGADAVGLQLVAYGGKDGGSDLIKGAIMMSGNSIHYQAMNGSEFYQPYFDSYLRDTGCKDLNCLRKVPERQLEALFNITLTTNPRGTTMFSPAVDGDIIPDYPSNLLSQGKFVKCPVIAGQNSDEGTSFCPRVFGNVNFRALIRNNNPFLSSSSLDALEKLYPNDPTQGVPVETGSETFAETDGPQFKRLAAYWGDVMFIANRRRTAETWSAAGAPTYSFRFNARSDQTPADLGATHGTELPYVFRNWYLDTNNFIPGNPLNGTGLTDLSADMASRWISFFNCQDPNAGSSVKVHWDKYNQDAARNIVFQTKAQKGKGTYMEKDDFRKDAIAFINRHVHEFKR